MSFRGQSRSIQDEWYPYNALLSFRFTECILQVALSCVYGMWRKKHVSGEWGYISMHSWHWHWMTVRDRLHNWVSLIPKKEPLYLWVEDCLDSGIELNVVIVVNVITAVITAAVNRTSAARHRRHCYHASLRIHVSFGSSQGKIVLYHEDTKKKSHLII